MQHKLGVIVPYRDREEQLQQFLKEVPNYLRKQRINFEIFVAEQLDMESFNRGALLNAGALEAIKAGCDYLVFHDVDLLPRDVNYQWSDIPIELVSKVVDGSYDKHFQVRDKIKSIHEDDFFGGVTLFPTKVFQKINGYSNRYQGWGFEDNDLLERCKEYQIPLKDKHYRQYSTLDAGLTFNGKDSYAEFNVGHLDPNNPLTILVTFKIDTIPYREKELFDEACIFSIPGYDLSLSYTGYNTYEFRIFDNYGTGYTIHTKKLPIGMACQAIISFEGNQKVNFYLNGVNVGSRTCIEDHRFVTKSNRMYLGVSDPEREDKGYWLSGQISDFAIFKYPFDNLTASTLFRESYLGFGKYLPQYWYSARLVQDNCIKNQGSRDSVDCYLHNCTVEPFVALRDTYISEIPYNRGGTFACQPHKSDGIWLNWTTRENQRRFRLVETYGTFKRTDGLSTLPTIATVSTKEETGYKHVRVYFNKTLKKK